MTDAERIAELEKQVTEMQETIERLSVAERFMAICRAATIKHYPHLDVADSEPA
jgi:uncharacterized coiled-coil protein SlyX